MLLNLKAALAARRVRQVDLALSMGISPSVLSEIINGRRTADEVLRARIAKELGTDELWLFVSHIPAEGGEAMNVETELVDVYEVDYSVRQLRGEFGRPKEEFGSVLPRQSRKIGASSQEAAIAYIRKEEPGFSVTVNHVKTILQNVVIKKRTAVAA